jgi:CBS domain-containing protein
MTTELFTVAPDDFVFEAIRLMGDKQIRRIPVIDETGGLAGIIAMADVALETEDEREIAETLEEISSGAGFWSKK